MTLKTVAPYGHWDSKISAEDATAGVRSLMSPRTCPHTGRAFFLVSTPDGANTIVEAPASQKDEACSVLPDPWRVGTSVYEYGGLPYAILPPKVKQGQRIVFSDPRDNACCILDVDAGSVTTLVPGTPILRYGDFHVHPGSCDDVPRPWILAVQEDHTHPEPAEVRNYIVGIHVDTGDVVRIVTGADFYSYPRFAPTIEDGYRISWRQWDHPDLPFDGVTLHWAMWKPEEGHDTCLSKVELVAGDKRQCIGEIAWAPDGSVMFGMERTGSNYRQLFRARPSANVQLEPVILEDLGKNQLAYVDLTVGAWTPLDVGLVEMKFDPLAALSASSFLVIGSGYTSPTALYRVDLDLDRIVSVLRTFSNGKTKAVDGLSDYCVATPLYRSTDTAFAPDVFSTPTLVRVPVIASSTTDNDDSPTRDVFGWFWPPHNRSFIAPPNTLPPLIVNPHGGPTGYTAPGLHMIPQYWATRGFAVFAINYSGSSGHGRAYRDSLWTRWGLLDRDDAAASVSFLVKEGRVDGARVGIEGGSAGGYNVLQSLVAYSAGLATKPGGFDCKGVFTAGVCACGVADTAALSRDTHKLESRYVDRLLWPPGTSVEVQQRIHRARSPLFHAERITAPLLLVHGDHDTVVPIAQSKGIRDRIQARGGDVELVVLPDEGHMFNKAESMVQYLQAQTKWWKKTLLR
ncbi:peptidase s9 prolyl oligopeptidase active site domain containing protein [Grosmannia clavigera kw1407]|uniref:Peptidase s9 prolyl oligopeptidase active site domain containing protein n=1 Tax=Grosmannia clavigera (strain kw1407 / UAMH 11150) TaxID=655863 RepID=F0XL11_GROCL|nr:peptidase s9 prolyl oligopeptidase active site domain containing protein [Grosmannia clavigera kw1407]EFX01674.1 peptidase s9 prolyl oligopeptidase active site domain containing protein [Grosmannia clavigera kw1407]